MAYVALSRSQRFDDIFIKGEVDKNGIHASARALEESQRLFAIFNQKLERLNETREKFWKISFLNIRSLNCNKQYVEKDNFLLSSHILGFGETWLMQGKTIPLTGYNDHYASFGIGKGVAVYSKIGGNVVDSLASEKYSVVLKALGFFGRILILLQNGTKLK